MGNWMRTVVRRTGLTWVAAGGALSGISCSGDDVTEPTTGSLEITTATSGPDPDGDGYSFAVDGGTSHSIGTAASVTLASVVGGAHSVQLSGVAENCRVEGTNPRSVSVTNGSTAAVTFVVACSAVQQAPRIAFTSTRDGNAEIYVVGSDGTGLTRLTSNAEDDSDPAWSPNGTQIAFARSLDIYVMNADGSGQTNLTNDAAPDFAPTWSPDGTRIAFIRNTNPPGASSFSELMVMNADGSGQTNLTNDAASDFSPTWSPDGRRIAFVREANPPDAPSFSEVMVINADGSDITQLSHTNGIYTAAEWSRGGDMIAFTAYTDSPIWIGVVLADGSREEVLAGAGEESAQDPAWSTDGKIAFSATPYVFGEGNVHYPEDDDIYVMNADGSGRVQLTTDMEFNDLDPAWSRDDRKIAFVRYSGEHSDIYVMNPDGTEQVRLTDHPANDFDISWSP